MKNTDLLELQTFYTITGTNRKNNIKSMDMIVMSINSNMSFRTILSTDNTPYYVMNCGGLWNVYQYSNNMKVLSDCTIIEA